jgi:sugar/nucleoside kinase (ribokinase family)
MRPDRLPVGPASSTLLMGTISLDRYLETGDVLPGGGILNMAWHWRHRLERPFKVLSRIGSEDGAPIEQFLRRHQIETVSPKELGAEGRSSSIDIEIRPDRQPWMDNFVPGVWAEYSPTAVELRAIGEALRLHVVLVEGAIAALHRLGTGLIGDNDVSADFLGFRHYTVERLAETMRHVDLGFIGWPGDEDAPEVAGMRRVAFDLGKSIVVTLGARAVLVFDGAKGTERRHPVTPVEVAGTTLGCGDAFIAWYLHEYWQSGDHDAAVAQGMIGGALATAWERPLPDDAYPT